MWRSPLIWHPLILPIASPTCNKSYHMRVKQRKGYCSDGLWGEWTSLVRMKIAEAVEMHNDAFSHKNSLKMSKKESDVFYLIKSLNFSLSSKSISHTTEMRG